CLDRITEITDELRRLIKEFETELAVLRGRVDGLEARVGELEATQFSTTTKLKGQATFVLGAVHAKGDNPGNIRDDYNASQGALNFSYDLRLGLKTSFTGKDLLFTRLRSGNFDNVFKGQGVNLTTLDVASNTDNTVKIDRLYYRFPLGSNFTVVAGPLVRNTEMMGYKPTAYARGAGTQLAFFGGFLGTPGVWSKTTGAGFGAIYRSDHAKGDAYWTVAANYVAENGNLSNPNAGGIMTDNANGAFTSQLAYGSKQWGLAAGYRYSQCDTSFKSGTSFAAVNSWNQNCNSVIGDGFRSEAEAHSWSVNGFWAPEESGWVPSISAGFSKSYLSGDFAYNNAEKLASWMVGLQWSDVFLEGNDLGFAVGQPQFVSALDKGTPDDGNYALELWYQFQVTDNIAITPGVFWLSRPMGDLTPDDKSVGGIGGVVQTVFKF
uniref:iron uptake porin n=1 Tax=Parasynechococcus sp. TaxID=3101203 RepID=UPI0037045E1F